MATIYGYGRHSTDKQGLTEEVQRRKVEHYAEQSLPEHLYGGWHYDSAVSGTTPLFERREGRNLWALAQPGDHIIWAKLDRAFRSVIDGAGTLSLLSQKGVFVHSLDLGLDTSTAIGRCICTVMLAFAELEREYASERTSEALEVKRLAGLPYNSHVPYGWKKHGMKRLSKFVPDMEERSTAFEMIVLRDSGFSYDRIVDTFWCSRRTSGRRWNRNTVRGVIEAARVLFPKVDVGVIQPA